MILPEIFMKSDNGCYTVSKSRRIGFRSPEPTLNMVRKSLDISDYLEEI